MQVASTSQKTAESPRDYDLWRANVQARFLANLAAGPVFRTNATGLFEEYLAGFPAEWTQHHRCTACRKFFDAYAGLAVIDEEGRLRPALWVADDAPDFYRPVAAILAHIVARSEVTGVFRSAAAILGRPRTGTWSHMALELPAAMVHTTLALSAGQAETEKLRDYTNVERALAEFDPATLEVALRVLRSDQLYRAEKVIGPVTWLNDLQVRCRKSPFRANLIWRAVATAPAGFCRPRTSMAGTLLEDIAAGMGFDDVSRRFATKMRPDRYQRPQAAPTAQNIEWAEELFAKMGLAPALPRRYARLEEVTTLWTPRPAATEAKPGGGVFGHLTPKGAAPAAPALRLPTTTMTWDKFSRTVLPDARSIELLTRSRPANYANYGAIVTAVDPAAPPLLQWDFEDARNPFSWYLYQVGSPPEQWGLPAGEWATVTAITLMPPRWGETRWVDRRLDHFGDGVFFLLEGMKDSRPPSGCLFPEILRSELHGVRATIEAYSRSATLAGRKEATACGLLMGGGSNTWGHMVRVDGDATYTLDRWD